MGCQQSHIVIDFEAPAASATTPPVGADAEKSSALAAPMLRADGPEPDVVRMTLQKEQAARLGSCFAGLELGSTSGDSEVVLIAIGDGSIIDTWNERSPKAVIAGDVLVEVNGHTEPLAMLEQLANFTTAELVFHRNPVRDEAWRQQVTRLCEEAQAGGGGRSRERRSGAEGRDVKFSTPVRAGDIGADSCSICMEDVESDEKLVQLNCGHAFHCGCVARWMVQAPSCACPLCRDEQ